MKDVDTICAVSTPPGEGGIGILRLSGPKAHEVLKGIFVAIGAAGAFEARRLYLGRIVDPETGGAIDEVFAVFMNAPRTYTKEDIGEVYSHGGFAAQRAVLSLMIRAGARLAEPGEFTKRAFLNGRIDLLQAESVLDVIEAETDEELKYAVRSLSGALSAAVNRVKEKLTGALVEVEALIDFPEEEIDVDEETLVRALEEAGEGLKALAESYYEGNAVRCGLEALIAGRTNVGKSSLLNTLIAKQRAIVTPLPGTTRDMIEDTLHIKGIKIRIVDTAGLGSPRDIVEEQGIARVKARIPEADLILWVVDGARPYSEEDEAVYEHIKDRRTIAVVNKSDLPQLLDQESLSRKGLTRVVVSALKGEGIEALKLAMYEALMRETRRGGEVLVTNVRHRNGLSAALSAVEKAAAGVRTKEPAEFAAFDLREAIRSLEEITGEAWTGDVLHEIFSRFCIGK